MMMTDIMDRGGRMKTRENELHEPKEFNDFIYKEGKGFLDAKYMICSVCGKGLTKVLKSIEDKKNYYPNYCPQCGARLKEIEE